MRVLVLLCVAWVAAVEVVPELKEKNGYLLLAEKTFDEGLEKGAATVIEFVKAGQQHESFVDEAKAKEYGQEIQWAQVDCGVEKKLCAELLTEETTKEPERDIMVYLRDDMAAHLLPRTVEPAGFETWLREALTKKQDESPPQMDWATFKDPDTLVLTEDNFEAQTKDKTLVVDFYAQWCGHCQALAPKYAAAASKMKGTFAKMDIDSAEVTAIKFNIEGLPTIAKVRNGEHYIQYEGARTEEGILAFATQTHEESEWKKVGAAPANNQQEEQFDWNSLKDESTLVLNDENFEEQTKDKTLVVDFYATWCGHCQALAPIYAKVSAKFPGKLAKVDVDAAEVISSQFNIEGLPTIYKVRNGKEFVEFNGERDEASIAAFVEETHDESEWQKVGAAPPKRDQEEEFKWSELKDPDTLILNDENFDEKTKGKTLVVDFFAQWCGHCQSLAPIYAEASSLVKGSFAKVDVDSAPSASTRFGVEGLPTILKIRDGKVIEYDGDRTPEGLVEFAKKDHADSDFKEPSAPQEQGDQEEFDWKTLKDDSTLVLSDDNFEEKLKGKTMVVDFYATWCGHCQALAPIYAQVSAEHPGQFAKVDVDAADVMSQKFNIESLPTIYKVRNGEEFIEFEGSRDAASLAAFAAQTHSESEWKKASAAAPRQEQQEEFDWKTLKDDSTLVLDDTNFEEKLKGKTMVVDFYATWCGHCQALAPIYAQVSAEHPGQFAKVDVDTADTVSQKFNIEGLPTIYKVRNGEEFIEFEGSRDAASLAAFAAQTHSESEWKKASAAAPRQEQEPAGTTDVDDADVVVKLTAKNWKQHVKDDELWIVDFYATWCGHCQKLAPIYAELARTNPKIKFGKVDTDQEEKISSEYNIEGLPTVAKILGAKHEVYQGDRNLADMTAWVNDQLEINNPEQIKYLSEKDFEENYQAGQTWVLAFTASWCKHCKPLKTIWPSFDLPVNVRREFVNADAALELVTLFNVTELPWIVRIGPSGEVVKYGGQRQAEFLAMFAQGKSTDADKVTGSVEEVKPWQPPSNVDLFTSDAAFQAAVKKHNYVAVLLEGPRHETSSEFRNNYLPKMAEAATPDSGLKLAVLDVRDALSSSATLNTGGKDVPLVMLLHKTKFWELPHATFDADELMSMAEEGLEDEKSLKLGFPDQQDLDSAEGKGSSDKKNVAGSDEDEFDEEGKDAEEDVLSELSKHEKKESAGKTRKEEMREPVTLSETHLNSILEKKGGMYRKKWFILFYDKEDPEWKKIWKNIWRTVQVELRDYARAGLLSWRDEPDLPELLGVERGFQAGLFVDGAFYLAPEIEGEGEQVVARMVKFAREGYLLNPNPQVGLPPPPNVVDLIDMTYKKETQKGVWLVMYEKASCASCKLLKIDLNRISSAVARDKNLHVAVVNTEKQPKIAKWENVDYHPMVKVVTAGHSFVYTGKNEFKPLLRFLQSGWKAREEETRPKPLKRFVHDEEPEEEVKEEEQTQYYKGTKPETRFIQLTESFKKNLVPILVSIVVILAVIVVGILTTHKKEPKHRRIPAQKVQKSPMKKKKTPPPPRKSPKEDKKLK